MSLPPYDLAALKEESIRIDTHIATFETKIQELRTTKTQYAVWIAQLEALHENSSKP